MKPSTKKNLIFTAMFIFSLPDILWSLANLIFAAVLYLGGKLIRKPKVSLYGRNIALAVDQFIATKAMGQDPDVSISMALGIARKRHKDGTATVPRFWLNFGKFVNILFGFQEDHVVESIEQEEAMKDTVIKVHDSLPPQEIKDK